MLALGCTETDIFVPINFDCFLKNTFLPSTVLGLEVTDPHLVKIWV